MAKSNTDELKFIFKCFDGFLEGFVLQRKWFLQDGKGNISNLPKLLQSILEQCPTVLKNEEKGAKPSKQWENAINQYSTEEVQLCFRYIEWLWNLPDSETTSNTKNKCIDGVISEYRFPDAKWGIGGASPRSQKPQEIKFLVCILLKLSESTYTSIGDIKKEIINHIKNDTIIDNAIGDNVPIKNALLYMCEPENYEPIFSNGNKKSIYKAFNWVLKEEELNLENKENIKKIDDKLLYIREILQTEYQFDAAFSFYDEGVRELWQLYVNKADSLDEVQLLEYKQAMVLYGPPGTSKTYSAINLAKLLVARAMIKSKEIHHIKTQLGKLFSKDKKEHGVLKNYVDRLQMHINYNYEDFVAGQIVKGGNVITHKGYIFDAIRKANENKNLPYVIILDEINRTDISRVFGEVFSAMEYRGDEIKLPLKDEKGEPITLCIPKNLFFIGTMNEIDFSLERIDFALRRRFVWVLKMFESSRLKAILMEMPDSQKEENEIDKYCKQCEALNEIISKSELGDNYVIGHAFFADIKKIFDDSQGTKKWEKSKQVLWQISIGPIIEAYCGSMEKSNKIQLLKDCAAKLGLSLDDKGKVSISNGKSE